MNLADNLTATAARHGDRAALRLGMMTISYDDLDALGDRVGVMLPNVPEFAIAYYGVLRAGAVVVPMNVLLKQREVAYYLADSDAEVMFAWHECADAAQAGARQTGVDCVLLEHCDFEASLGRLDVDGVVADRAGEDTAVILYTSGT